MKESPNLSKTVRICGKIYVSACEAKNWQVRKYWTTSLHCIRVFDLVSWFMVMLFIILTLYWCWWSWLLSIFVVFSYHVINLTFVLYTCMWFTNDFIFLLHHTLLEKVWVRLTDLTLQPFSVCLKPVPGLSWEVAGPFADIGEIVNQHCLSFLSIIKAHWCKAQSYFISHFHYEAPESHSGHFMLKL